MGYDANRDTDQSKLETRVLVRKICGRLVELAHSDNEFGTGANSTGD